MLLAPDVTTLDGPAEADAIRRLAEPEARFSLSLILGAFLLFFKKKMILLSLTFTTAKRYNTCFFSRGIQAVEGSFTRVETKAVRAIRRLNAAVPAGLPPLTVVSALGGRDTPALRKEPAVTTIVPSEAQTNHTAGRARYEKREALQRGK